MSTMDEHTEIEAWDRFASQMQHKPSHVIHSHRAARVPSAFPIRRILMGLTILTMGAVFINGQTVTLPEPQRAVAAPTVAVEPQNIPEVTQTTPRVDTGSEVDSDPRDTSRAGRSQDERKPIPPVVETAIAYALAQVGDRYRWGAAGPSAFDCSGLVMMAFKQIGISLPHYTGTMISRGQRVAKADLKRGDIIFPSSGHVAIYLGNGKQVAASSSKASVVVQNVYAFYAARRLV